MNSQWTFVATTEALQKEPVLAVTVNERRIVVVQFKGNYHALDGSCYHSGGPLDLGEIVEIEDLPVGPRGAARGETSQACIVCPWHHFTISLQTGEGVYKHMDLRPSPRKPTPSLPQPPQAHQQRPSEEVYKSKGVMQRVHETKVTLDGQVYVRLVLDGPSLPCDKYSPSSGSTKASL